MPTLALAVWLAGCGSAPLAENTRIIAQPFPAMTEAQVEAMVQARGQYPVLDEWWDRFTKAWEAAVN